MSQLTKTLSVYRIWQKKLVEWKEDLTHLVYPNICLICEEETTHKKILLCHLCENDLHYTHFENYTEFTKLDKLFWGRVPVEASYSLLYFEKEISTQKILHGIKYQNKKKLALEMGSRIGSKLIKIPTFIKVDCLIPIPLHAKKEYQRGYNQSRLLAEGIAQTSNIPCNDKLLKKSKHSESQTKKGRFKRWENVQNTFTIDVKNIKNYKHIALVDDVVTTGATLEACVREIKAYYPKIKISIITLAIAK
jgi:ComF family protein